MKKFITLIGLLSLAVSACRKNGEEAIVTAAVKVAACDLVTKEEVSGIQGTTISAANESEGVIGSLSATQCYYSSTEPNKSVTIGVIQPKPGQPGDPITFWRETFEEFGDEKDRSKSKSGDREEEEKHTPPTKVAGIGDEAYWVGGVIGGTFYVLKKDRHVFLRISVGGPDTTEIKLEKSRKIATKALERL